MHRVKTNSIVLIAAVLAAPAWGLDSDRDQPMHLEADSVTIDDQQKISRYSGAVQMSQGSVRATGDEIIVHSQEDGPERIIIVGSPATFRQRPEGKEQDAYGQAQRIEHDSRREITHFVGEARFWQGKEEFTGASIEYDATRDRVRAQGSTDGSSRVRIVIQPSNKSDPNSADSPTPKAAQ